MIAAASAIGYWYEDVRCDRSMSTSAFVGARNLLRSVVKTVMILHGDEGKKPPRIAATGHCSCLHLFVSRVNSCNTDDSST